MFDALEPRAAEIEQDLDAPFLRAHAADMDAAITRPDYVTQPEAWSRWYREHHECEASGPFSRCYLPRAPGSRRCACHTASAERAA
jgi:hypothetical protein